MELIIVDDLNMGAVVKNYSPEDYALKAILAGADLLIVINRDMVIEVKERIKQAVEDRIFSEKALDEAVERRFVKVRPMQACIGRTFIFIGYR